LARPGGTGNALQLDHALANPPPFYDKEEEAMVGGVLQLLPIV
jgi:hypothetical protein